MKFTQNSNEYRKGKIFSRLYRMTQEGTKKWIEKIEEKSKIVLIRKFIEKIIVENGVLRLVEKIAKK